MFSVHDLGAPHHERAYGRQNVLKIKARRMAWGLQIQGRRRKDALNRERRPAAKVQATFLNLSGDE
jgi:hypothetical protein